MSRGRWPQAPAGDVGLNARHASRLGSRFERDGSTGAEGTSAEPRPLCGPRTRPACLPTLPHHRPSRLPTDSNGCSCALSSRPLTHGLKSVQINTFVVGPLLSCKGPCTLQAAGRKSRNRRPLCGDGRGRGTATMLVIARGVSAWPVLLSRSKWRRVCRAERCQEQALGAVGF